MINEPAGDTAEGLHRLEGYLAWQAEVSGARRAAGEFADRLPWLTTAQREAVERAYTQERLRISEQTLGQIARRCRELRHQHEERYRRLRCRLVALSAAALALAAVGAVLLAHPPGRW